MTYPASLQYRDGEVVMGEQQEEQEHISYALHPFRYSLPLMQYRLSRCLDEVLQQFPNTNDHPPRSSSSISNTAEASSPHSTTSTSTSSCFSPSLLFLLRRLGALLRQSSLLLKEITPVLPPPHPTTSSSSGTAVVPPPLAAMGSTGKEEFPSHDTVIPSSYSSSSCPPLLSAGAAAPPPPPPHEEEQGDLFGEESSFHSRGSSPEPDRYSFSVFPQRHPLPPPEEEGEEMNRKNKMIPPKMEGNEYEGRKNAHHSKMAGASSTRLPLHSTSSSPPPPPLVSFVQEDVEGRTRMPLVHHLNHLFHDVGRGYAVLDAALREPPMPLHLLPLGSPSSSSHLLLPLGDVGALAMMKVIPAPVSVSSSSLQKGSLSHSCDYSSYPHQSNDKNEPPPPPEKKKEGRTRESVTIENGRMRTNVDVSSRRMGYPSDSFLHENVNDDPFHSSPLPFLLPLGVPATHSEEEKINNHNNYYNDDSDKINTLWTTCMKVMFFPHRESSSPNNIQKRNEIHRKRDDTPPLQEKRTCPSPSFYIEEVDTDVWEISREEEEEEITSTVTKRIPSDPSKATPKEENGGNARGAESSSSSPSSIRNANVANVQGGDTTSTLRRRRGEEHRLAENDPSSAIASSRNGKGKEESDINWKGEMKSKKIMAGDKEKKKKTEEEEEDAIMSEVHSLVQEMKQRALQMGEWMRGEDRVALGKNEALLSAGVQQGEENIQSLSKLSDAYGGAGDRHRPPPAILSRLPYGRLLWTQCVLPLLDMIKQILLITIVILLTLTTLFVVFSRSKPSRYSPLLPASHASILTTSSSSSSSSCSSPSPSASPWLGLGQKEGNGTTGMGAVSPLSTFVSLSSRTNNTNQSTFFSTLTHYLTEVSSCGGDASCSNPSSA